MMPQYQPHVVNVTRKLAYNILHGTAYSKLVAFCYWLCNNNVTISARLHSEHYGRRVWIMKSVNIASAITLFYLKPYLHAWIGLTSVLAFQGHNRYADYFGMNRHEPDKQSFPTG